MPELRSYARSKTVRAINVLYRIMMSEKTSPRVRMAAANSILDRGWGRPVQAIEAGETPFQMIHRIERVIVDPSNAESIRLIELSNQTANSELVYDDRESHEHPARTAINRKSVDHG